MAAAGLNHGRYERVTAFVKRGHEGKRKHATKAEALEHQDRLNLIRPEQAAINPWTVYTCPLCHHWHVGRPPLRPKTQLRDSFDVTMVDAIGERAWYCGVQESTGHQAHRRAAIRQRGRAALKRAAYAYLHSPGDSTSRRV